jgi:hypothetical protein
MTKYFFDPVAEKVFAFDDKTNELRPLVLLTGNAAETHFTDAQLFPTRKKKKAKRAVRSKTPSKAPPANVRAR